MPCSMQDMRPEHHEVEMSRVMSCIDEIIKGGEMNRKHFRGYHPLVYQKTLIGKKEGDKLTKKLCSAIQKIEDISEYSLELQMWWRDHQEADKARLEKELKEAEEKKAKEEALKKLTKYERELLGL